MAVLFEVKETCIKLKDRFDQLFWALIVLI